MQIAVPDGALVVLVGVAGSGKTTFAARHFGPDEILSSDAFRGRIGSGEADQTVSRAAFAVLHRELAKRLGSGRTTVVDATNVTPWARQGLLHLAVAAGRPAIAIVLDLPEAICIGRNAQRAADRAGADVPQAAIRRQSADLRRSLRHPGLLVGEGFSEVHRLGTPDAVDAVEILRIPDGGIGNAGLGRAQSPGSAGRDRGLLPLTERSNTEEPDRTMTPRRPRSG
jgi:predicted kinase